MAQAGVRVEELSFGGRSTSCASGMRNEQIVNNLLHYFEIEIRRLKQRPQLHPERNQHLHAA